MTPSLQDLGEDHVVALLTKNLPLAHDVVAGPGDDCAIVASQPAGLWHLLKTDAVVEHIHFHRSSPPSAVGWKAACRPVSDVAAMAGLPSHALVSVIAPPATPAPWLRSLYRGLAKAAHHFHFSIVGGDTSATTPQSPIVISVAMLGKVEPQRCLRRSGARPGDLICVTGRLGGSLPSGRHLKFVPRVDEARWLAARFLPTAMMDLSDGLARDLPRLAAASRVGWSLHLSSIPRHRGCSIDQALVDGEDYELLFTISPDRRCALESAWRRKFPRLPLTVIGTATTPRVRHPRLEGGFAHFHSET